VRLIAIAAAAGALLLAPAAPAQDPASRIDSNPRIELRPPVEPADAAHPPHRPGHGLDEPVPAIRSDRDRRLDLELELKARNERLHGGSEEGTHWVAAAACVAGCGIVLVAVMMWVSKRRGR
jgi:hypothetical protein